MKTIPLTHGHSTIVDDEDFDFLSQWSWRASVRGGGTQRVRVYATRTAFDPDNWRNRRTDILARVLMNPQPGYVVDHINGDSLDNRRANLRVCLQRQNAKNRRPALCSKTGFVGVAPFRDKFKATVRADGKSFHVGVFPTAEAAALARDAAARRLHGEFARLNFPEAA